MSAIINAQTDTWTRDLGSGGMGPQITSDSDGDSDGESEDVNMDWNSAHEFVISTVPLTQLSSTRSNTRGNRDTMASRKGLGTKREKLKSLKEKTINNLWHSGKDIEVADVAGGSRKSDSSSPCLGSLITRTSALLAHPRAALKASLTRVAVGRLSTLNAPYISHAAELEFVEAHNDRDEARKAKCQGDVESAERRIEELVWQRRNMQVNWTMDRHVNSVTVAPTRRSEWPAKRDFLIKDESGKPMRETDGEGKIDYVKWLGQFVLYETQDLTTQYIDDRDHPPPVTIDRIRSATERLFVSTAPWQEWYLHIHRVSRWEDPYETFRWLTLYVVLWHYSYIFTFVWSCVCFFTLRRYFNPEEKVGDLRNSIERTRTAGKQAQHLGELIEKNGPEEWLVQLSDSLGPWLQLQLNDLANFVEILENFYEWRSPRLTLSSLTVFFSCFLVGLITDTNFCMKAFLFFLGVTFFFWLPVSSRYPKYRYVISPLRWIFWGIPTHAEWAFQELRNEAQKNREKIIGDNIEKQFSIEENGDSKPNYFGIAMQPKGEGEWDKSEEGEDELEEWYGAEEVQEKPLSDEREFASFKCRYGHHLGRLVIYPWGISFTRLRKHRILWRRGWWELVEMKKMKSAEAIGRMLSLEALEISFTDGGLVRLVDMADRNEAFKWILGYSRLRWRSND